MTERNVCDEEVCLWSVGEPGEAELFVCRPADLERLTKEAWGESLDFEAHCHDPADILNFSVPLEELRDLPEWALEPLAEAPRLYQPEKDWDPQFPIDPEDPETLDVIVRVKASEILEHAEQHGLFLL